MLPSGCVPVAYSVYAISLRPALSYHAVEFIYFTRHKRLVVFELLGEPCFSLCPPTAAFSCLQTVVVRLHVVAIYGLSGLRLSLPASLHVPLSTILCQVSPVAAARYVIFCLRP